MGGKVSEWYRKGIKGTNKEQGEEEIGKE